MTDRTNAAVVVGVDGSPSAQVALDWAATEASAMHRPLRIVHAFIWPMMRTPLGFASIGGDGGTLRAAAERLLVEAESRALSAAPDIKITTELVVGAAAPVLLGQARDAEVVVVGNRGLGGFTGLLVGSVGVAVAAHAPCPVVVVHARSPESSTSSARRIVVGTDGSDVSSSAIRFAFQTAARRGVLLTAIRTWIPPLLDYPTLMVPRESIEEAEHQQLLDTLSAAQQMFPGVEVEAKVVCDVHPGRTLVTESASADLVVVGSRGRGGFAGLLLGSVSQSVLEHAKCPVAIVRPRQ